jgi:hypothetical protein
MTLPAALLDGGLVIHEPKEVLVGHNVGIRHLDVVICGVHRGLVTCRRDIRATRRTCASVVAALRDAGV